MPKTIVVMGVSGCGKSLIGEKLSQTLGGVFEDADDFHSLSNKEKMANGIPLNDDDRRPWLHVLREQIVLQRRKTNCFILACSALKQSYRDVLRGNDTPETLRFVYLKGTKKLIGTRMEKRHHFMPRDLLDSQFATLEEPCDAMVLDAGSTPGEIVSMIINGMSGTKRTNSARQQIRSDALEQETVR